MPFTRPGDGGQPKPLKVCAVAGCQQQARCKGWCQDHYDRARRGGDPLREPARRKGVRRPLRDGEGYVRVYAPDHPNSFSKGYILEHTMVMSEVLGRPLEKGENVHHINGLRDDNRPENLELWVTSQPSGQRPADLLAWAHEIIRRYGADNNSEPIGRGETCGPPVQLEVLRRALEENQAV